MKLLILLSPLLFWSITFDKNQSDVYLFKEGQSNSLLSLTQPGDVIIYESHVICSGCVEFLAPVVRRIQTDSNVFLLSSTSSNQVMRYRLNDWGKYLKNLPIGLQYDSISLSLTVQSPLIIFRDSFRFKIYDNKYLFDSSIQPRRSVIRGLIKDYKEITK
ncbi:MAG: hypothetical protein H6606_04520 [Flavobacteriales bacterium]|nr:hypothetical protein [Flavobacteriales bacterium]